MTDADEWQRRVDAVWVDDALSDEDADRAHRRARHRAPHLLQYTRSVAAYARQLRTAR